MGLISTYVVGALYFVSIGAGLLVVLIAGISLLGVSVYLRRMIVASAAIAVVFLGVGQFVDTTVLTDAVRAFW